MFASLPTTHEALYDQTWDDLKPYFDDLAARTLDATTADAWLTDWSRLSDLIGEYATRLHVATTQNTADADSEMRLKSYLENIEPNTKGYGQILRQKLVQSGIVLDGMAVPLRNMRAAIALFRQENIPIQTEIEKLRIDYNKLIGAQNVTWEGETRTLRSMETVLQSGDRTRREAGWRAVSERQLADRDALNSMWGQLLSRRRQLAAHAGHPDFRSYAWQERLRFDYSPDDSLRFLDAIAEVVVPAANKLHERQRRALGVETLRPWDMTVEPGDQPPLRPFADIDEFEDRAGAIFDKLDPELSHYYAMMRDDSLLDLDNRPNKAPGGYCTAFPVSKRPFIFMNAVGVHMDVRTLIHEAGHAFHAYEKFKLPYAMQRTVTAEYNEVASMAMELLTFPYWGREQGGYYDGADADRARVEHLEKIIHFWPYMAIVDGFQHWAYTHPESAADPHACDDAWMELATRFEPFVDYSGLETHKANGWQRKLHIYLYPFYYVDYGMAQLGAVQVWARMIDDAPGALAAYKRGMALGGTATLPDLYATTGAKFQFDRETLGAAVELIMGTIETLQPTST
ncbi:MAG: M3 family oligoendopeptidase [Chloroflexota bacterium]|nr:M3 family oligoendopeptidase [Chloroflexota bacterium]